MKSSGIVLLILILSLSPVTGNAGGVQLTDEHPESSELTYSDVRKQLALSEDKYQRQVQQLENENGVYDPQLSEALLGLGLVYRARGNNSDAIMAFERALHIQRINSGLYNLDQVRIVQLIIESASDSRDWNKLGERLHYLLWVYRRNYDDDDERLLPEIEKLGELIVGTYQTSIGEIPFDNLVEADDLYDEVSDLLKRFENNEKERVETLYRSAMVNYYIAHDIKSPKVSHHDIRAAMLENRRAIPTINESELRDHFYEQSFFKGKRAINAIIEIYEEKLPASIMDYVAALTFMGDWYLIFRQKQNAMPYYRDAYETLVNHGVSEEKIKTIFGQPKPLKILTLPGKEAKRAENNLAYVDAVIDVPDSGWPANIRIVKTNPEDDNSLIRRGVQAVAGVRYRPRFENGKPVDTRGVSLQYVFDLQPGEGIYLEQGGENAFFLKDVVEQ